MSPSKRTLTFIILILFLTISNFILLFLALNLFPAYGGFSRQILFIKPDTGTNEGGYFIILDELSPEAQNYDVDWMFHSRGNVVPATDQLSLTTTVKSYITNDSISLNVSFLEPITTITEEKGYFFPDHYREPYPYDDLETEQIKAKFAGSNKIMASVLYPKNDSDGGQKFPTIVKETSGLRKIGAHDYFYYSPRKSEVAFTSPALNFEGEMFFIRKNDTDAALLEYFYLQNAESLTYSTINYLSIQTDALTLAPPFNILATYANYSQISGYSNTEPGNDIDISIYCPFIAEMVKLDGINTTFSQTGTKLTFSINGPKSFVISRTNNFTNPETDPLRIETPIRIKPVRDLWEFDIDLIKDLEHPFILFNKTELYNLTQRINDTNKPWKAWYAEYNPSVISIKSPGEYGYEDLYYYLLKLSLSFAIDGGQTTLTKIKQYLDYIGPIQNWTQDLKRSYAVQAYAMAYDIIYQNLTQAEKTKYYNYLDDQAAPLMLMDIYSDNNHRVVDAGGLGCAGLALKNATMVDIAIDTILEYYYNKVQEDGGSYEGYSYNGFAVNEILMFIVGLKRRGGFNFFEDPQIIATLQFFAETLSPIGLANLYEDCTYSSRVHENILIGAAQLNDTNPTLASNFQYIWEQRQNISTNYVLANDYAYIKGDYPSFIRITCYDVNDTINATAYTSRKEIWKESDMAFLRSADIPEALFMSFSCKSYRQSHTHLDENSFELWAYGALLVNNPGYPGWGITGHDWSIRTEASNTLLINGAGQAQLWGEGLSASISSPYFSMVIGEANEIYTDSAAPQNAPELYFLFILNFIFIGIASILFLQISKSKISSEKADDKGKDTLERSLSKSRLVRRAFTRPNQTQEFIYHNDPFKVKAKTINRTVILLTLTSMAIFYTLLVLDIKTMLDYHAVYYESKYQAVFDLLPIIAIVFVFGGSILTILFSLFSIGVYKKINRMLVYKSIEKERLAITKKQINSASSISLVWIFPILLFSFILIYLTTAQTIKNEIHLVFTMYGSPTGIYGAVIALLLEFIRNLFLIMIFGIPFNIIMLYIFSHGIYLHSDGKISKRTSWKISLTSLLLLLVIAFTVFILIFIGIKQLFAIISIELVVE